MRTIQDVKVGEIINSHTKGVGEVIKKTKRTITIKFKYLTTKRTYFKNDAEFEGSNF